MPKRTAPPDEARTTLSHPLLSRRALGTSALGVAALLAMPALAQERRLASGTPTTVPVDLVVIEKGRRRLHLYYRDRPLRTYRVALGSAPIGHKRRRGDGRTPEGLYRIDLKRSESKFGMALRIDYPNAKDRAAAAAASVDPGGEIYIHGQPAAARELAYFRLKFAREDWTDGCIGLADEDMAEIFRWVRVGTPVLLRP